MSDDEDAADGQDKQARTRSARVVRLRDLIEEVGARDVDEEQLTSFAETLVRRMLSADAVMGRTLH